MKIALAQYNPIVGDIAGNSAKMAELISRSAGQDADLVVFGELSVIGYPPRDLLRKERFVAETLQAVEKLAACCTEIAALVGYVRPTPDGKGRGLQNVAALLVGGKIEHVHVKALLPTYDVFDETRYFDAADKPQCITFDGVMIGLSICEDLWDSEALGRQRYGSDPVGTLAAAGAEIIVNMAASPYEMSKAPRREELFTRQGSRSGLPIVYVNQVGGNDELIFDGASCVVTPAGEVLARAKSFEEDLLIVDLAGAAGRCEPLDSEMVRLSAALKLGLRDYVTKCGFKTVVLGLSGGLDSAVVATLAADALGPQNVYALAMPSKYSSDHSLTDAEDLAKALGIHYQVVPIKQMHETFEAAMGRHLEDGNVDIADENIQARIRGAIVMAYSNAFGHLPLATGNKSELSCGYCTLYGDMCGGLAPIGDLLKTVVYELASQLNAEADGMRIPASTLTKPPSAELKPDQTDQDKLPPYELLDAILTRYIEADQTAEQIIAGGAVQSAAQSDLVRRIVRMVDAAEYKRRQAAPVLKATAKAFGTGRRMPIAQKYISGGQ